MQPDAAASGDIPQQNDHPFTGSLIRMCLKQKYSLPFSIIGQREQSHLFFHRWNMRFGYTIAHIPKKIGREIFSPHLYVWYNPFQSPTTGVSPGMP